MQDDMHVTYSTSTDVRFAPDNVLDPSNPSKFWVTTGMYPQEIMIELERPKPIYKVKFMTNGAKTI